MGSQRAEMPIFVSKPDVLSLSAIENEWEDDTSSFTFLQAESPPARHASGHHITPFDPAAHRSYIGGFNTFDEYGGGQSVLFPPEHPADPRAASSRRSPMTHTGSRFNAVSVPQHNGVLISSDMTMTIGVQRATTANPLSFTHDNQIPVVPSAPNWCTSDQSSFCPTVTNTINISAHDKFTVSVADFTVSRDELNTSSSHGGRSSFTAADSEVPSSFGSYAPLGIITNSQPSPTLQDEAPNDLYRLPSNNYSGSYQHTSRFPENTNGIWRSPEKPLNYNSQPCCVNLENARLQNNESVELTRSSSLGQPVSATVKRDLAGAVQGTFIRLGQPRKKRNPRSEIDRENALLVRQRGGSCDRCKRLKRKCILADSPFEPCDGCRKGPRRYKGGLKEPCIQLSILNVILFRERPSRISPLYQPREQIYHLEDPMSDFSDFRILRLTHGMEGELEVYVSEFEPSPDDKTAYTWLAADGQQRMEMPPYALTKFPSIKENVERYIYRYGLKYLIEFGKTHALIWHTIGAALSYGKSQPKSLVSLAIRLWCTCRMIEKPWTICGKEKLGVPKVEDPGCPCNGTNPITPMMDAQLDQIVIQWVLYPLRTRLLAELDRKIKSRNPQFLFEIYLTIFILLCNCESIASAQLDVARKFGVQFTRYPPTLDKYFESANTLICYFSFVCNGSGLIQTIWSTDLNKEETKYLKRAEQVVKCQEDHFRELKNRCQYEKPLYWCHQLFYGNWRPPR